LTNRPVTVIDVAERAGVSPATVSRYLNGHTVRSADRVRRAIVDLQFRPSHAARSLKSGRAKAVAILGPDATNPFASLALRGAEAVARSYGYGVMLYSFDPDHDTLVLDDVTSRADGVILTPRSEDDDALASLRQAGVPVVLLDGYAGPADATDAVIVDNRSGTRVAVEYLIGLGHTRIASIHGRPEVTVGRERADAFRATMKEFGLSVPPEYEAGGRYGRHVGYSAMLGLLSLRQPPTAVFVGGNLHGVGALRAVKSMNTDIPGALSLVVFDDYELFDLMTPPITVVERPMEELGAAAMTMLIKRLEGDEGPPQLLRMPSSLVIRGSCAPPRDVPAAPRRRARTG
jgi:LacI family transcriptional regulator